MVRYIEWWYIGSIHYILYVHMLDSRGTAILLGKSFCPRLYQKPYFLFHEYQKYSNRKFLLTFRGFQKLF